MDLKGKSFLVIGGGGFIGSHVVDQLLQEGVKEVIIYDNFSRGSRENLENALRDPRVSIFPLGGDVLHRDILDKAVEKVDGVFHLAALWLLHCHEFPASAFEVNIRGTFNVIQSCIQHKTRLVYSSSASVYGNAVSLPMDEDHPYNNFTFYGATKIAGEHMLKSLGQQHSLPWVALRYMNVYGCRQDYKGTYTAVMHKILDKLEANESPVVYGDGSQQYDFVDVRDVARANVCAMKSDIASGFYNVGRGVGTSIKELSELILRLKGSDKKIEYLKAGQTFVTNRIGGIANAEKDIGYRWTIDLETGMRDMIRWREEHQEHVKRIRREGL